MVTKADKRLVVPSSYERDDPTIEYPETDGEPLADNKLQAIAMVDSFSALETYFAEHADVYIGINQLLYYVLNDPSVSVAPDVFAVFGAQGSHPRPSWIVSREGGLVPNFVLEVASESTWRRDVSRKRVIYAGIGVSEYWRFDPDGSYFPVPLVGERLVNGEYEPIAVDADADGVLRGHSDVLGLDICVREGSEEIEGRMLPELRLYDPVQDEWLLSHRESEVERLAAQERAAAAQERASAAEERIRQLEAQMRLHGIAP